MVRMAGQGLNIVTIGEAPVAPVVISLAWDLCGDDARRNC